MSDLAIITSPFQALNMVEYFQEKKPKILVLWNEKYTLFQIQNTLKYFKLDFEAVEINYLNLFNLLKYSRKNFSKVAFANIHSIPVLFCLFFFRYESVLVLDDGTQSLLLNEKFNDGFLKNIILQIVKYKINKIGINYFSIFKSLPVSNEKLISNNFNFINRIKLDISDENIFIGQPLLELKEIDQDSFFEIITKLKNKLNFKYIVHRRDSIIKLNKIKSLGIELLHIELPIELHYITKQIIPNKVFSFSSTALFTLKGISKKSEVYFLDYNVIKNKEKHKLIQNELGSYGIKKFNLND